MNWLFEKFSFQNSILRLWHWKFVIIKGVTCNTTAWWLKCYKSQCAGGSMVPYFWPCMWITIFDLAICCDLALFDHSEALLLVSHCILRELQFLMIVIRLSWLNSLTFQNQFRRQRSNILRHKKLRIDNVFSHSNHQFLAIRRFHISQ